MSIPVLQEAVAEQAPQNVIMDTGLHLRKSLNSEAMRKQIAELIEGGFNASDFLRGENGDFSTSLADCRLLSMRKIEDRRGNLTSIESGQDVPFDINRIYYLYDVPGGSTRAGHAHKNLHQLFVAMSGSFDITLRDGTSEQRYHMNRSYQGLYVPPMIWRDIDNFSSGSICLVLASEHYDEEDYLRSYPEFMMAVAEKNKRKP